MYLCPILSRSRALSNPICPSPATAAADLRSFTGQNMVHVTSFLTWSGPTPNVGRRWELGSQGLFVGILRDCVYVKRTGRCKRTFALFALFAFCCTAPLQKKNALFHSLLQGTAPVKSACGFYSWPTIIDKQHFVQVNMLLAPVTSLSRLLKTSLLLRGTASRRALLLLGLASG